MEFKQKYNNYRFKYDKALAHFFAKRVKKTAKIDKRSIDMVKTLADFTVSGGSKRLRPVLTQLGYELVAKQTNKAIVDIGMAIELYHSFLLVHDDFIDRDILRHNKPTTHVVFEKKYRQRFKSLSEHFGASFAIITGDLADVLAGQLFEYADFSVTKKNQAKQVLFENFELTVYGEFLDVYGCETEAEVWRTLELKTAYYTFVNPLSIGAILAGATKEQLRVLERFAKPVGIAFQIRDDVIGLFGNSKQTGKDVGADVREKKVTPLIFYTRKLASKKDKATLNKIWKKTEVTSKDIKIVRDIVARSGALEHTMKIGREFVMKGKKELDKIKNINQSTKKFLGELADYIIEREK